MRSPIAPRTASGSKPVVAQLLTVSLLALALAGCKTLDDEPGAHVAGWTLVDPTQRHPIMVSQQPSTMNVRVARGSQGLTPAQKAQVAAFLERYRAADAGNSKLVIAVPSGSPNECAAVRARRRHTAADHGLRLLRGERRDRALPRRRDAGAPIRLSYLRYVAEGPECGRWTTNLAEDYAQPALSELRLRAAAQSRRPDRQSRGPARAPHHGAGRSRSAAAVVFDKYRQGRSTGAEKSQDERIQVKTTN